MRRILVGFLSGTVAAGVVTVLKSYNVTAAGGVATTGDYYFTIGQGGVDNAALIADVTQAVTANGTDIAVPSLVLAGGSDTVKRVQWRDKAGTLADPLANNAVSVTFYRVPSSA